MRTRIFFWPMFAIALLALASDAIVIVTHTSDHLSYKTKSTLPRTLTLLQKNYLRDYPVEVIVFYTGPRINISFPVRWVKLEGEVWSTPPDTPPQRKQGGYTEGYRHMCQFYSFRIWRLLANYSYIMRLDDDSFLCRRVKYNVFDIMRENNADYGYRMLDADSNDGNFKALVDHTPARKPYNNFFVAKTDFFLQPAVQQTLRKFDDSRQTYTHRMGDLHVHGHIICMHNAKLVRFDMCYEHATIRGGCPVNGGIAGNTFERANFKRRYRHCKLCQRNDVVGARGFCVREEAPCETRTL